MKRSKQFQTIDFMECLNWNQRLQQQEHSSEHAAPLEALQQPKALRKPSLKNKYVKKLSEIDRDISTLSKHRVRLAENESHIEEAREQVEKKFKNRVAAKESRDRKKLYVNLMQQEIKELEEELQEVDHELQATKATILKSTFTASEHMHGSFTSNISHVFRKLFKLTRQEESEERNSEIDLAVDSLCYRMAGLGKERVRSVNQYYKQIIHLGFPTVPRYVLWAARHKSHIFAPPSDEPQESWFQEIRQLIGDVSQNDSVHRFGLQIQKTQQQIGPFLSKFSKVKKSMQELCERLDQVFLDVRAVLTPVQLAKFLLCEQSYRYWEQLRFPESTWFSEEKKAGLPKKHIKTNTQ